MPTCITHAVVGVAAGMAVAVRAPRRFLVLSVACAMLPDLDMLGFVFGIPYDSLFGHRGITHSLLFAVLAGPLVMRFFFAEFPSFSRQWWLYSCYFFALVSMHGVLDALTNGGEGIAFLAPFSELRFFFDYTPIEVSPVNMLQFFDGRGMNILVNEMVWIWAPLFTAAFLSRLLQAARSRRHNPAAGLKEEVSCRKRPLDN